MTRFLFTTAPTNDLGLLTRSLPIANELRARGHEVVFSSPARAPARLVADAGFENLVPAHPLYEVLTAPDAASLVRRALSKRGKLLRFAADLVKALPVRRAPATAHVWDMDHAAACMGLLDPGFVRASCAALIETLRASRADVVVDFWNPFAVIAARSLGTPVVTVIQGDAHPDSGGFRWWRTDRPAGVPSPLPVVNRVLVEHGLAPVRKVADLSLGDLTLVVGTPETDPLPPGAAVSYIGAVLWQKRESALPRWIEELPRDRPLVWVYSGNPRYGRANACLDSMVVLEASIAALERLPVHVVLTTGHHELPAKLRRLPAAFRHEAYVPGLAMAERSDLLIHHGGYGSCQTGLYCGKPAVILPTYSERESNARRVAALGAAEVVPVDSSGRKKRVSADDLRAAAERVLADPSYARNAARAGELLRSIGGAGRAADLVEQFARSLCGGRALAPARAAGA